MLTQLPHLPAASANALTGTRTVGAAPWPGKAAHRRAANEPHAHNDRRSPAGALISWEAAPVTGHAGVLVPGVIGGPHPETRRDHGPVFPITQGCPYNRSRGSARDGGPGLAPGHCCRTPWLPPHSAIRSSRRATTTSLPSSTASARCRPPA